MHRRGFFRRLLGAAVTAVTAPITSLVDAAVEQPVFNLMSLPLPVAHSDFWSKT